MTREEFSQRACLAAEAAEIEGFFNTAKVLHRIATTSSDCPLPNAMDYGRLSREINIALL